MSICGASRHGAASLGPTQEVSAAYSVGPESRVRSGLRYGRSLRRSPGPTSPGVSARWDPLARGYPLPGVEIERGKWQCPSADMSSPRQRVRGRARAPEESMAARGSPAGGRRGNTHEEAARGIGVQRVCRDGRTSVRSCAPVGSTASRVDASALRRSSGSRHACVRSPHAAFRRRVRRRELGFCGTRLDAGFGFDSEPE